MNYCLSEKDLHVGETVSNPCLIQDVDILNKHDRNLGLFT